MFYVPFCAVNVLFHFMIAGVAHTHFVDSFAGPLEKVCISRCPTFDSIDHMGVSNNRGTPKWMVCNGNPIKMDDWGVPLFSETSIFKGANIE